MRAAYWQYIRKIPALIYGGIIIYLSHQTRVPSVFYSMSDKFWHFLEYFAFAVLIYFGWGFVKENRYKALLFMVAFAASDEIHQYFVAGRSCSFLDFLTDALGIVAVFILLKIQTNSTGYWYNFF